MTGWDTTAEWDDLADRLEASAKSAAEFAADMRRRAEHARIQARNARGEALRLDGAA